MLIVQRMQVLAELIISNESRIIESNSVSFYNRMRSIHRNHTVSGAYLYCSAQCLNPSCPYLVHSAGPCPYNL